MPGNPDTDTSHSEKEATENQETSQEPDYKALYETTQKRFKDTQAAFTKSQQTLKKIQAEKEVLQEQVMKNMTPAQAKEMEELKYSDPDAYIEKMTALQQEKVAELNGRLDAAGQKAAQEAELERRTQVLAEFNASHPGFELTDEVIANDVPRRIFAKLEKGEVSFEEFLEETHTYLNKPKKVASTEGVIDQPNLNNVGGGDTPSKSSTEKDIVKSYKNEVY